MFPKFIMGTKNNSPNPTPKRNKFENINIAQPMSNATWTPRGPEFFSFGEGGGCFRLFDFLLLFSMSSPKMF
jgi:hypothetical protein